MFHSLYGVAHNRSKLEAARQYLITGDFVCDGEASASKYSHDRDHVQVLTFNQCDAHQPLELPNQGRGMLLKVCVAFSTTRSGMTGLFSSL